MRKATVIYLAVNMGCLLLYSLSFLQLTNLAKDEPPDAANMPDILSYAFAVFPFLAIAALYSIAWFALSVLNVFRNRSYQGLSAFGAVVAVWAVAVVSFRSL